MDEFDAVKQIPTRTNLTEKYPQEFRVIILNSTWFIAAFVISFLNLLFLFFMDSDLNAGRAEHAWARTAMLYILLVVAILCLIKLIYEYFYLKMLTYIVELDHLTVTSGIFFRSRASFPLARINDISLKRSPLEMIFFLYTLEVLTASPRVTFGRIYGLSKVNAVNLQSYILTLVETTLPNVQEHIAEQIMERPHTSDESDHITHQRLTPDS